MPLWEAIMGKHESVIQLLVDNGAKLSAGDVGHFACVAVEQNNLSLLKEIVRYGGDVTLPKINGSSALHVAVCEGNIEIVKYLLDRGANVDQPDEHNWTPRDLAEQQGHEDIKELFESRVMMRTRSVDPIPEERGVRFLGRFKSEPTISPASHGVSFLGLDGSLGRSRPRRRSNNFHNSLFGIMSAKQTNEHDVLLSANDTNVSITTTKTYAPRVIVCCPEKGDNGGKLILLPQSFKELLQIGSSRYGISQAKVVSKDGAEIDEIELIRDGDRLVFVRDKENNIDEAKSS